MATLTQTHQPHRLSKQRIILGILLFIALLAIAWAVRTHVTSSDAPSQSTEQAQPNVEQNTPPTGQVNQGGDPTDDTTASPDGTNGVDGAGR